MKEKIISFIKEYVNYSSSDTKITTSWREPIISFADANDIMFTKLKDVISPSHALPTDFLKDAKTVICYFIPFSQSTVESNINSEHSSREWAVAYVETNNLITNLNRYIIKKLEDFNVKGSFIPATHNFDKESLKSDWSHRHVAYIAGLGKFGINNMLITEKGCCGRIGTIVTNLKIEPTTRSKEEYCLYKISGKCMKCISRCICGALDIDSFERHKCYEMLLYNDKLYKDLDLTDTCGKCCVDLPCSFQNPVK